MYRSSPHTTTGRSPAELLFGRPIRTKLPNIEEFAKDDTVVRDRGHEKKEKGRIHADSKRGAKESEVKEGDKV